MQIEKHVRWLWRFIMMPILFGLIGNAMRFNTLQKNSIAKACGIIVAGRSSALPCFMSVFLACAALGCPSAFSICPLHCMEQL